MMKNSVTDGHLAELKAKQGPLQRDRQTRKHKKKLKSRQLNRPN